MTDEPPQDHRFRTIRFGNDWAYASCEKCGCGPIDACSPLCRRCRGDQPPNPKLEKLRAAGWPGPTSLYDRRPWLAIAILTLWVIAAALPFGIMLWKLL